VQAHVWDLRAEVGGMDIEEREEWLEAVSSVWRAAALEPADRLLCAFADKLTRTPAQMGEDDVSALRKGGFDEQAIHDAVQVISYFNYINRVADALHVDLEPEMAPYPR
jgi:uncharacterized peroxidase-related enzyme